MAVYVSTAFSICLYCKTSSESNSDKEFHEIFDDVGLELQLPILVEKFFHQKLTHHCKQVLCEDCLDRLIELYDLEEHGREDRSDKLDPKGEIVTSDREVNLKSNLSGEQNNDIFQVIATTQNDNDEDTQVQKKYSTNVIANVQYNDDDDDEIPKNDEIPEQHEKGLEIAIDILVDGDNNEIDLTQSNEDYQDEDNIQQKEMENNNEDDIETNEDEVIESDNQEATHSNDDEDEYEISNPTQMSDNVLKVELMKNLTNKDNIDGTEIPSEELDFLNEDQIDIPNEQIQNTVSVAQSPGSEFIYNDPNDFVEEHVYDDDEVSLLDCKSEINVGGLYYNIVLEQENIEEFVESVEEDADDIAKESESKQESIEEFIQIDNDILGSVASKTNSTQDNNEVVEEVMIENIEDETMSTEEEYIIEVTECSDELDCVDLSAYMDNVLLTKFEKLDFKWSVECKLCLEKYETLQDLLDHSCIDELFEQEKQCCCIFKDCKEIVNDFKSLARHLIIQHYDKLESLSIYSRCTDCEKNFSNFIELNKHSCCRNIKRKSGTRKYCKSCDMDFSSLKRFIFHMQFHLIKHRPKVCLLCGALFKNSNDFFEHTQYKHEPEISMACIKCDRFFTNIDNYESHMELHDELKYTFACTYCPKKYTKKSGLNLHMDVYHNHKKKLLQCEYCDKQLATNSSYRNHMKSHVPEAQVPAFVCSECGLITDNSNFIKDHLETNEESPCYSALLIEEVLSASFTCENCSIDFRTKEHLAKHRLSSNHDNKIFYCNVCRKKFKSFRHMRNHSIKHKDYEQCQDMFSIARFYMCDIENCQESYPLWSSLYYHKKRRHKDASTSTGVETEFKCQFCPQILLSKMSLALHIARSHNKTLIRCSYCSQSYKDEKSLNAHVAKFHTAVQCSICLIDFKNRRNLESHEKQKHANEKRYFCKFCKKGYFYKSEMESHAKYVHTDTLYKCEICNFITGYPKSLEIHMDRHNNKLGFQCTICSKSFGRKQLLKVHMKRHEETKEYVCCDYYDLGCNASFLTYNLMKTHIQKKHENSNANNANLAVKRNRSSGKCSEIIEIQDETSVTLLEINRKSKRLKRTTATAVKDVEFETVSIEELITTNDISEEEQQIDHEFTIQYEDDNRNSCE